MLKKITRSAEQKPRSKTGKITELKITGYSDVGDFTMVIFFNLKILNGCDRNIILEFLPCNMTHVGDFLNWSPTS